MRNVSELGTERREAAELPGEPGAALSQGGF